MNLEDDDNQDEGAEAEAASAIDDVAVEGEEGAEEEEAETAAVDTESETPEAEAPGGETPSKEVIEGTPWVDYIPRVTRQLPTTRAGWVDERLADLDEILEEKELFQLASIDQNIHKSYYEMWVHEGNNLFRALIRLRRTQEYNLQYEKNEREAEDEAMETRKTQEAEGAQDDTPTTSNESDEVDSTTEDPTDPVQQEATTESEEETNPHELDKVT